MVIDYENDKIIFVPKKERPPFYRPSQLKSFPAMKCLLSLAEITFKLDCSKINSLVVFLTFLFSEKL